MVNDPVPYSGEEGSGTLASIGVIAMLVMCGCALIAQGLAHARMTYISGVADSAALGGAKVAALQSWVSHPERACELAENVATKNAATMASCTLREGDIFVVVSQTGTILGIPVTFTARARAGPEYAAPQ